MNRPHATLWVHRGGLSSGALASALFLASAPAFAGDSSPAADDARAPGRPALERARAAWEKGDFDVAEPLYVEALDSGGLAPAEVLEAYVHLGCARAVLGKKAAALAAFKSAGALDLHFIVPADAGKRATALADLARRAVKTGALVLRAELPGTVAANAPIGLDVTLDHGHAAMPGTKLGVYAESGGDAPSHTAAVAAATSAHFELPASLSLPSATVRVRVDWMDGHRNHLAEVREQVHVQPLPEHALAATPLGFPGADGATTPPHDEGKHAGFWHTAWPYILGGAALAAGGAALFFATRPSSDVDVTGVRVVTH